jgi:hypothetical protein
LWLVDSTASCRSQTGSTGLRSARKVIEMAGGLTGYNAESSTEQGLKSVGLYPRRLYM